MANPLQNEYEIMIRELEQGYPYCPAQDQQTPQSFGDFLSQIFSL